MTPSLTTWSRTVAGWLCWFCLFLLWCGRVAMNKISAWDWAATRKLRNHSWGSIAISRMGDGWLYAAFVLWGRYSGHRLAAGHVAGGVLVAWGCSSALKVLIRRRRPHDHLMARIKNQKLARWNWWRDFPSSLSFPSQHAACAVAFAVAVPSVWTALFAGLVCWSRVAIGSHFAGDVLAGIVLGAAAGVWG